MDDVLAAWDAVDADVEEAADGDGEEENNTQFNRYKIGRASCRERV